ncbi:MAG: hypothetical protein ACM34H_02470 [Deltaproteobacteria bacterium]
MFDHETLIQGENTEEKGKKQPEEKQVHPGEISWQRFAPHYWEFPLG